MKLRSVGICLKPGQPQAAGLVRGLGKWLEERGLRVGFDEDAAEPAGETATPRDALVREADLVIVLGGDGTLLSVARHAGARAVPILGVNLGTLGFMTEIAQDELFAALERVLGGQMRVESRMRLEVRALREGEAVGSWLALNDAVVANATSARLVEITACVDGDAITTYHADGLIVATPTGSTAYSLSAGGPLLLPDIEAMVLTPICPHSLNHRPLVLPEDMQIEVVVQTRGGEATVTMDGQEGMDLEDGDRVSMRRSPHPVDIIASPLRSRFQILQAKLRWGER